MNQNIILKKGDCLKLLKKLPDKSVDMIFADPPYNLSGKDNITCKNGKKAQCNKGQWDIIEDINEFNFNWLSECVRVLKDEGTIWISGTLHNHPSIGHLLKKLNLWIINDIIWFKPNAPPQLQPNRLAPSTELIWLASKTKKYFFNYNLAKKMNGGKQMRNLWELNATRHLTNHPTEKPEKLMERIILLGSKKGDIILDPFMGSGTTGVIAKRYERKFIGMELDDEFFDIAEKRIKDTKTDIEPFSVEFLPENVMILDEKEIIVRRKISKIIFVDDKIKEIAEILLNN